MATTLGARLGLTFGLLLCPASVAAPVSSVTEAEAVRLFLEQSPQAAKVPLVEASAESGASSAARSGS